LKPLLIILGPTASGKTHLATRIADQIQGEIISADSRQVYRKMDIGTGKDINEYTIAGKQIPYHLIDIKDAGEQYNVNEFQKDFRNVYQEIASRNAVPIVCGGTGFYIYSLLKGYAFSTIPVNENLRIELEMLPQEELHRKFESSITAYSPLADTSTRKRLIRAIEISEFLIQNPDRGQQTFLQSSEYDTLIFGINPPVEIRRERISARLKYRLENGLIGEVKGLLKSGLSGEQLIYYGLEYKFVTMYLLGQMSYSDMSQRLESEIHRFAKRQMTFFRKMEKDGIVINWLDYNLSNEEKIKLIVDDYKKRQLV